MCTGGFPSRAHIGLWCVIRKTSSRKALAYLLDVERQGEADGFVSAHIGLCYLKGWGCKRDMHKAMKYFENATEIGSVEGCLHIYNTYWKDKVRHSYRGTYEDAAIDTLLTAHVRGLQDPRLLHTVIKSIVDLYHTPDDKQLGSFDSELDLASHYADILIQQGNPHGYRWKAKIEDKLHWRDVFRTLALRQEADTIGLADHETYISLAKALLYVVHFVAII